MALIRDINEWPDEFDVPDGLVGDHNVQDGEASGPMFLAFALGGDEYDIQKARHEPLNFLLRDLRIPGPIVSRYVLYHDFHGYPPQVCIEALLCEMGFDFRMSAEDDEEFFDETFFEDE